MTAIPAKTAGIGPTLYMWVEYGLSTQRRTSGD